MKSKFFRFISNIVIITLSFSLSVIHAEKNQDNDEVVLYLVRHGKTMLNTTNRVQGWSDAVLIPSGISVAENVGLGLKDKKINFVAAYSSDSGRSIQTANIILEKSDQKLPLQIDWRLREFNFGSYEGDLNPNLWTDIAKTKGLTMKEWMDAGVSPEDFANSTFKLDKQKQDQNLNWPAEDYQTITKRLKEATDAIVKEVSTKGGGNVLVVSHGLSIVALINTLDPTLNAKAGLSNASITRVIYKNGQYTIKEIGDNSYMELGKKLTESSKENQEQKN